jgi:hypothetical protein
MANVLCEKELSFPVSKLETACGCSDSDIGKLYVHAVSNVSRKNMLSNYGTLSHEQDKHVRNLFESEVIKYLQTYQNQIMLDGKTVDEIIGPSVEEFPQNVSRGIEGKLKKLLNIASSNDAGLNDGVYASIGHAVKEGIKAYNAHKPSSAKHLPYKLFFEYNQIEQKLNGLETYLSRNIR